MKKVLQKSWNHTYQKKIEIAERLADYSQIRNDLKIKISN